MATITRNSINVSVVLALASFVTFLAAEAVAQAWLTAGTWQEWVAAGLALWVLSTII